MGDLTRQQLCASLQVSESTVRRLEIDGLPCTPVGRAKRYDLADCKRWLRERQCQSGQTKGDGGASASWSTASAFIESSRRVQVRAIPSASKRSCGQP